MTSPVTEMTARAREVFRRVVESYLDNGMPVGSKTLSQLPGLNISPASIRGVMQDLEEQGLLGHPHISAGRVPTETGLRLFVDGMMQAAAPSAEERAAIEAQVHGRRGQSGPIEEALGAATAALSGLSACAGIILVPAREPVLRQFGFVPLGPGQALAVLVGEDGSVEHRVIALPDGLPPGALAETGAYMSARLTGLTLGQAQARLAEELQAGQAALDAASGELVARGLAVWSEDGAAPGGIGRPVLIVRGQANLIDDHAAADLERVRRLLGELEQREEIARLLDSARGAQATQIFIGSENKLFSLSGSSVIAAPYRGKEGRVIGVVGVIGPTRLNYARVVPMVDFTAQTLTRLMT